MQADLPDLSRDALVELGGWAVFREARELLEAGAVQGSQWEKPLLSGEVKVGAQVFAPRLNLRSMTFAENRCNCPTGRKGYVCAHAVALCLHRAREATKPAPAAVPTAASPVAAEAPAPLRVKSLQIGKDKGVELRFRVLLPPNLAQTAPRNLIAVKVEAAAGRELLAPEKLYRGQAYRLEPAHERVAALIESWCGGRLHGLLNLKRAQLQALLEALRDTPFVAWVNVPDRPLVWDKGRIAGVHDHLGDAPAAAPDAKDEDATAVVSPAPPRPAVVRRAPLEVKRSHGIVPTAPRAQAVSAFREERRAQGGRARLEVDGSTHFLAISLPDRDDPSYEAAVALLRAEGFSMEASNRRWWLRDRHKVLNFLARHQATLEGRFGAIYTENYRLHAAAFRPVQLACATTKLGDGFDLTLQLHSDGLEDEALRRALASGQHYVITADKVHLIDPRLLEQAQKAQRALAGEPTRSLVPQFRTRVANARLSDVEQVLEELDTQIVLPAEWKQRSAALRSVGALKPAPVPAALDERLRSYQRIGAAWLWHLHNSRLGGVLADEMGLGKTVQALALIACIRQRAGAGPCLVVGPAGLVGNWMREASRFLPGRRAFAHHGAQRLERAEDFDGIDLVITSYATLVRDAELFRALEFSLVIADEAQHVKNRRTQAAQSLRALRAQGRFVLTGTPIENSLDDLRALFDFILPGYLQKLPPGLGREDRAWHDARHRQQAAPYILRRDKRLVAPELPEKLEQVLVCDFGPRQKALYDEVLQRTEKAIFEMEMAGAGENQVRFAALTQLLRLRQVCADPRLVDEQAKPADSAKLEAFGELLEEAIDGGHRILVFSQFVTVLTLLRGFLEERGHRYGYIDGGTADRLAVCDRFNNDPDIPVCLISLKAGGTGLNLTGADTVVHYDPWWNPAAEAQATDRAHRIGQTRTVTSYKLIAAGTVEEKVLELQRTKAQLLRDLLDDSAAATAKVSLDEIKELIRR